MNKFTLLIGLPGVGKSYFAKRYVADHPNTVIISSDAIREELWGDANDQTNPARVFDEMFIRSVRALQQGHDVIYDATNLVAKTRKSTLTRLRQAVGMQFVAVARLITCSISECKRRQGERDRKVPDEVIDRMVRQFQVPYFNEGWDVIFVNNSGKKQNVDHEHWRMLGASHDNPHHTSSSLEMHCAHCEGEMRDLLRKPEWLAAFSESTKQVLIEAAYHHDIGKHKTKVFHNTKGNPTDIAHYYSHDNVGAYLWLSGDKIDKWDEDDFLLIAVLIQWHMQPYFLRDKNGDYREGMKQWCDKKGFSDEICNMLCLLHEADRAAH